MDKNRKNCLDILTEYLRYSSQLDSNTGSNSLEKGSIPETQAAEIEDQYTLLMKEVSRGNISLLQEYVDALIAIKYKERNLIIPAKRILTSEESLRGFQAARNNITDLYPLLAKVDGKYSISSYYELSLEPECYLYGASFVRYQEEQVDRVPCSNEIIQAMLDLFIHFKDNDRLLKWIMSILMSTPESIIEKYRKDYTKPREDLKMWMWDQVLNKNKQYKNVVIDKLFNKKGLKGLVNNQIRLVKLIDSQQDFGEENKALKRRVKDLEEKEERGRNEHQKAVNSLNETIRALKIHIEELEEKERGNNLTNQLLNTYIEKYNAQISINERVVIENDKRVKEIETKNGELVNENIVLGSRLEELSHKCEALESDYNLTRNELEQMREADCRKEYIVRRSILGEMISGLNEKLFYLTCFYNDLHENGKLEPEGVELFADTLNSIDSTLSKVGVQKIGTIDQIVKYDSSIHSSSDAGVSNGDEVIVSGYGWKIGDEIYIKAPVEKGNK